MLMITMIHRGEKSLYFPVIRLFGLVASLNILSLFLCVMTSSHDVTTLHHKTCFTL